MISKKLISIVVPVYNEEAVISELYKRLHLVLSQISVKYSTEIIFVNDGSTDLTLQHLNSFHNNNNSQVKIINLSRNFGHQIAVTAGIDFAKGDAVIIIDADLQDPPELIPEMRSKWEEGYQVVHAVRRSRKGESKFKLYTANIFYRLINQLSDVSLPLDSGDFKLIDRQIA